MLTLARRRLERSGGDLDGIITLTLPSEEERKLIIGLTGLHRPPGVKSVRIPLAALNEAVVAECGMPLIGALEVLQGPIRNRPAERSEEAHTRVDALADARRRAGRHADDPWFTAWLEQLTADGTLTRLVRRGDADQLGWACDVLALLPAQDISLPVLAERATGNTKALSGSPVAGLVLRALALRDDVAPPGTAAERRERWDAAGVIMDDLASQVLVLGLRPVEDHSVATWLREAADAAVPFRLTLHQLTIAPITLIAPDVFVCENPAVLRAAVADWDSRLRATDLHRGGAIGCVSSAAVPGHGVDCLARRFRLDGLAHHRRRGRAVWRTTVADVGAGLPDGHRCAVGRHRAAARTARPVAVGPGPGVGDGSARTGSDGGAADPVTARGPAGCRRASTRVRGDCRTLLSSSPLSNEPVRSGRPQRQRVRDRRTMVTTVLSGLERLAELGLSVEVIARALRRGDQQTASCTALDPPIMEGLLRWGRTTAFLREELIPLGWSFDNPRNLARTIHPTGEFAIVIATGDEGTGLAGHEAGPRHAKGYATEQAIHANGQLSFEFGSLLHVSQQGQAAGLGALRPGSCCTTASRTASGWNSPCPRRSRAGGSPGGPNASCCRWCRADRPSSRRRSFSARSSIRPSTCVRPTAPGNDRARAGR